MIIKNPSKDAFRNLLMRSKSRISSRSLKRKSSFKRSKKSQRSDSFIEKKDDDSNTTKGNSTVISVNDTSSENSSIKKAKRKCLCEIIKQRFRANHHRSDTIEEEKSERLARYLQAMEYFKLRTTDSLKEKEKVIKMEPRRSSFFQRLLFSPHSTIIKVWQIIMILLICFECLILPYLLAFYLSKGYTEWEYTYNSVIDVIYLIDIVFQFNTARTDTKGNLLTERKAIAIEYAKSWLLFDLLTALPFHYITVRTASDAMESHALATSRLLRSPHILRIIRLIRLKRLVRFRIEWEQWFLYSRYATIFRLVGLTAGFLYLMHCVTCLWWSSVVHKDFENAYYYDDSLFNQYATSFYFCILVTFGEYLNPFESSEAVFFAVCLAIGSMFVVVFFGHIQILMREITARKTGFQQNMERIFDNNVKLWDLPEHLKGRIEEYYLIMWRRYGTLDGRIAPFINELSENLAKEVLLFLRMDMLQHAPFFKICSAEIVGEFVLKLESVIFLLGDCILIKDQIDDKMYFIQCGECIRTCDVKEKNENIELLRMNEYFGELALLLNYKSIWDIHANSFVEICVLKREAFNEITDRYVEDRLLIEDFITSESQNLIDERAADAGECFPLELHNLDISEARDGIKKTIKDVQERIKMLEERAELHKMMT